jgi:hypothetical protein
MARKLICWLAPVVLLALSGVGCSPKDYHDIERSARAIPAKPAPANADV